ncbi:hypothetical protein BDN72DRAFT_955467 [Pluteus cervinus]|uniref:Uncharacterized protein n=1 Tax=Pluteus cervinus TaxID=181527 RepID=A0ACD3BA57_9AGAR|nr:hypothetical protein BDN72DRAFT_955467 [Pluteus cervinus]
MLKFRMRYGYCRIWEKKYGKGANHKKKEMVERQKAIAASLAKRGTRPDGSKTSYKQKDRAPAAASFRNKEKAPGQHQQQPDSGWSQRSAPVNSNMERQRKSGNAQTNAERPLHPSWEAKRKLKEKESSGGIIPSQGKKIKFS